MGSQLSSANNRTAEQQQQTSNYQSLRSSPVRKPFSSSSASSRSRSQAISNHIVVVNRGPTNNQQINSISLPKSSVEPLSKPLVSLTPNISLNPDQPRLKSKPVIEIGRLLEQNFRLAAETVATEQQKIVEQIRLVDQHAARIGQTYIVDKPHRINKAAENFTKFEQVQTLINRCEADIEQLLQIFAKLNSALPESLCLENFEPPN